MKGRSGAPASGGSPAGRDGAPLLRVRGLEVRFPVGGGLFGRAARQVEAVRGVDFDLPRGETLGLVGESGSGKTSTARAVLRLVEPAGGTVLFDGREVGAMATRELRTFRRRAQIVFQDPFSALNPRLSVEAMLREALEVHGLAGSRPRARVVELLERVGLGARHLGRYPHEFSGGQRQRLGIARALSVEPELLVLDEPVSSLDVSVQAQVLNLLADLQAELGLTYLFIAHDLAVVRQVSDRVAVMYQGRIVETGDREDLYARPRHPYTRVLLSAVPGSSVARGREAPLVETAPPTAAPAPTGCPYHPRCPDPEKDASCRSAVPLLDGGESGHRAACFKAPPARGNGG